LNEEAGAGVVWNVIVENHEFCFCKIQVDFVDLAPGVKFVESVVIMVDLSSCMLLLVW
jgi:hypothetical protein